MDPEQQNPVPRTPTPPAPPQRPPIDTQHARLPLHCPQPSSLSFHSTSSATRSVHTPTLLMKLTQSNRTPLAVSAARKALHAVRDEHASPSSLTPAQSQQTYPLPPASLMLSTPSSYPHVSTLAPQTSPTPATDKTISLFASTSLNKDRRLPSSRPTLHTLSPNHVVKSRKEQFSSTGRTASNLLSRQLFLGSTDTLESDLPYLTSLRTSRISSRLNATSSRPKISIRQNRSDRLHLLFHNAFGTDDKANGREGLESKNDENENNLEEPADNLLSQTLPVPSSNVLHASDEPESQTSPIPSSSVHNASVNAKLTSTVKPDGDENILEKTASDKLESQNSPIPNSSVINASANAKLSSTVKPEFRFEYSPFSKELPRKESSPKVSEQQFESRASSTRSSIKLSKDDDERPKIDNAPLTQKRLKKRLTSTIPETNPRKTRSNRSATTGRSTKVEKKSGRMSEVLRLQKSLASASWTDSKAVERQTKVLDLGNEYDSVSPGQNRQVVLRGLHMRGPTAMLQSKLLHNDRLVTHDGVRTHPNNKVKIPRHQPDSQRQLRSVKRKVKKTEHSDEESQKAPRQMDSQRQLRSVKRKVEETEHSDEEYQKPHRKLDSQRQLRSVKRKVEKTNHDDEEFQKAHRHQLDSQRQLRSVKRKVEKTQHNDNESRKAPRQMDSQRQLRSVKQKVEETHPGDETQSVNSNYGQNNYSKDVLQTDDNSVWSDGLNRGDINMRLVPVSRIGHVQKLVDRHQKRKRASTDSITRESNIFKPAARRLSQAQLHDDESNVLPETDKLQTRRKRRNRESANKSTDEDDQLGNGIRQGGWLVTTRSGRRTTKMTVQLEPVTKSSNEATPEATNERNIKAKSAEAKKRRSRIQS